MARPVLHVRRRDKTGKEAARRIRRNNQIPAIFYGPGVEPVKLAVGYPELDRLIKTESGENIILGLEIESDGGTERRTAIIKELQVDSTRDAYLHADFYEISMEREITVNIPIHLINTPVGVTDGGVLQHIRREMTVSCLPDKLIDYIEVDISGLGVGDSVHVRDIHLPDGIKTDLEDNLTVAVVAAPTVAAEKGEEIEEPEAGEGIETEGEVTES